MAYWYLVGSSKDKMSELKTLYDVLGQDETKQEVYTTDQKKRYWRSQKGQFSKTKGLFNFLHLIKDWESIVGTMMAKNTVPLKIKSKTLIISTKHAIFAQELGFLVPVILEKIKEKYPDLEHKVTQIKFSHSKYSAHHFNHESKEKMIKKVTKKSPHKFSPHYKARVHKAQEYFSHIEDEEVKKMLMDFMLSYE